MTTRALRPSRVRAWLVLTLFAVLAVVSMPIGPAFGHKDHKAKQEAARVEAERAAAGGTAQESAMTRAPGMAGHAGMMDGMGEANDPPQTFGARLLDWLGRFHPMLVHFPIAFIPAALFTAIVGRRRPGFAKPVQFLVVTAGVTAPFAMLSGWLSGGFALGLDDWLTQTHRWLGTGIGIGAFALGVFALKRPEQDRGTAMITGLSVLTAAIIMQGWFGGALVHGIDHLNW